METPEILSGDIAQCTKTGAKMIVNEVKRRFDGTPSLSCTPLPSGHNIKHAWWNEGEYQIIEKGAAHHYYQEGVVAQLEKDAERDNWKSIEWVLENFDTMEINSINAETALSRYGYMPDQTGLMSRGEIGIMAMGVIQAWHQFGEITMGRLRAEKTARHYKQQQQQDKRKL